MRDAADDPRAAFLKSLPRKSVEIKATLGALIADPRSTRMRDELRRRVHTVYSLARSYQLPSVCDGLKLILDVLDGARAHPVLPRAQLDRLAALVASLSSRAALDTREGSEATAMALPQGTRSDLPSTRTLFPPALQDLLPEAAPGAEAVPGAEPVGTAPARTPTVPPPALALDDDRAASGRRTTRSYPAIAAARSAVAAPTPGAPIQVLLCGAAARATSLLEACGNDVEVAFTRAYEEAVTRARETAPDVIVAELDPPADGVALLDALKSDPVTEFLPVILLASAGDDVESVRFRLVEAYDVLPDSTDGAMLRRVVLRATGSPTGSVPPATGDLGELTLEELTRALSDELMRGLVGAASPRARSARIPLGSGGEVLAATWEAIARIREVVERSTEGGVRFQLPAAPRGLPGTDVFALGETPAALESRFDDDPLPGRRAVVVDDDPTVVAQFGALLRESGMEVVECTDGDQALRETRRCQPDVVLSDILMPGLDGFGLCRAIRRDVALRHTPVILLSWKEDLLQRMRELGAQAAGYLRKDATGEAVLARLRGALRVRVRLLKRIADLGPGAEVRGRVEQVGAVALLSAVGRHLRDARVTLTDAVSVTEIELRGAEVVSAVRTAQDGGFVRGDAAILRALAASGARFAVSLSDQPVRSTTREALDPMLQRCARRLSALEAAVSGASLLELLRVDLDVEVALAYARSLPAPLRTAVERIAQGDAPRDLVFRDGYDPAEIEPILVELARSGAVVRALGPRGEDIAAQRASAEGEGAARVPPKTLDFAVVPVSGAFSAAETSFAAVAPGASDVPPVHEGIADAPPPSPPLNTPAPPADVETIATLADAVWREMQEPEAKRPGPTVRDLEESWSAVVHDTAVGASLGREVEAQRRSSSTPPAERAPLPDLGELGFRSETPPAGLRIVPQPLVEPAPRLPQGLDVPQPQAPDVPAAPAVPSQPPPEPVDVEASPVPLVARKSAAPVERPSLDTPDVEGLDATAMIPGDLMLQLLQASSRETAAPASPAETSPVVDAIEAPAPVAAEPAPVAAEPAPVAAEPAPIAAEPAPVAAEPAPAAAEPAPAAAEPAPAAAEPAPAVAEPAAVAEPTAAVDAPARTETAVAARVPSDSDGGWLRPVLLVLAVAAAFAGSYFAVRQWVGSPPEVQPEGPTVQPGAAEDAAVERDAGQAQPPPLPVPGEGEGPDAATPADADTRYVDPQAFLDGGSLAAGTGLIVIRAPRAGASPVSVDLDRQPLGQAPVQARASEGLHTLRYRAGILTSFQFVSVRSGRAVVLDPPSDR